MASLTMTEEFRRLLNKSNHNEFFDHRKHKMALLEDSVEIAKALGVTVEYLVTGELDKPDTVPIIQSLEAALEELRRL